MAEAFVIWVEIFGPDHPYVANGLNSLAVLYVPGAKVRALKRSLNGA
jgi:hypothetical protein